MKDKTKMIASLAKAVDLAEVALGEEKKRNLVRYLNAVIISDEELDSQIKMLDEAMAEIEEWRKLDKLTANLAGSEQLAAISAMQSSPYYLVVLADENRVEVYKKDSMSYSYSFEISDIKEFRAGGLKQTPDNLKKLFDYFCEQYVVKSIWTVTPPKE